jgi:hypothetical protein
MPRTTSEILSQAESLAKRFEDHDRSDIHLRNADSLRRVREAFQRRAAIELEIADAVVTARDDGQSWTAIGAMLGTSGEAARQRYGAASARLSMSASVYGTPKPQSN